MIYKVARRDVTQKWRNISRVAVWILYDHSSESRSRSSKALGFYICGNEKKKGVSLNEAKMRRLQMQSISYHLEYVKDEEKKEML